MRRSHLTWLAALFIACVRPAAPPAAPEPTPSPTPEVAVSFREDATSDGLTIDLYEGRPAAPGADRLATPATEPLPDAETWELLEHIPPLPAPAGVEFRVRKSTLPPPQAGEVVPFAPPTDDAPPAASGPLTVVRHSPDGAVPMAPQLSVSFSRPMIPLTSQDEAAAMVPVTLSPTPRGSWRWLGTQTLIFDADPRFPMATRYQVSIPAGTKAIDGTPLEAASSWTFETPPLTLVSSWPSVDAGPQPLEPVMVFTFDQAISPEALLPFTRLDRKSTRLNSSHSSVSRMPSSA